MLAIRNAFEHIDERAVGKAHREGPKDAESVFGQSDFFCSGVSYERQSYTFGECVPGELGATPLSRTVSCWG